MAGFFYKLCEKCYRKSSKYMRNNLTRLQGKKMINVIINKYIEKKKKVKWRKNRNELLKHSVHGRNVRHAHPQIIRPFTSSRNSYFKNEAKYKSFKVKMSFICIRIKNHFHINDLGCFRLEKFELDFKIRISDLQSNAKSENGFQRRHIRFCISILLFEKGFEN